MPTVVKFMIFYLVNYMYVSQMDFLSSVCIYQGCQNRTDPAG